MTGRDLISASLRLIGAVAPGENIAASEATDGLSTLNRMIDSWSNESLLIYSQVREEFPLVSGTQSYTIGTGGVFNTTRPLKISHAAIKTGSGTTALEYPMNILSLSEWTNIIQKGVSINIPSELYFDPAYPLANIYVYPSPSASISIVLWSEKQITSIATLDTSVSLPPGYQEALIYNCAIRLAPEYQQTVSQEVAMIAAESKAAIKRTNHKSSYLRVDDALLTSRRFNIFTGGSR